MNGVVFALSTGEYLAPANATPTAEQRAQRSTPAVLYALDSATGEEIWKKDLDLRVWGPIAVQNGVLFVPRDTFMTAYDPATGEQLYEYAADGTITTAALAYGGRLFFGNGVQWLMTTMGIGMNVLTVE